MKVSEMFPWSRGRIVTALVVLLALGVWAYTQRDHLSRETIMAYGKALPIGWFLAAYLVLPLLGVPISLFLFLAGVRFGFAVGLAVMATGMLFHNCAVFRLVHGGLRQRLADRLQKHGHRIPAPKERNRVWFTVVFVGIQGPPYAVKLYSLALTDLPFRIYVGVGTPIYILFGLIPLLAGSTMMTVNPLWFYAGVFGITALVLGSRWLKSYLANRRQ